MWIIMSIWKDWSRQSESGESYLGLWFIFLASQLLCCEIMGATNWVTRMLLCHTWSVCSLMCVLLTCVCCSLVSAQWSVCSSQGFICWIICTCSLISAHDDITHGLNSLTNVIMCDWIYYTSTPVNISVDKRLSLLNPSIITQFGFINHFIWWMTN